MKPEDIKLTDFYRIFFGETPAIFSVEVLFRILILILTTLVAMRLMGKRMSSQLSIQEMAVLVTLAAAIGMPMQTPDRGILPAMVIAILALGMQRIIAYYAFKNPKAERITQGVAELIIEDGVLLIDHLKNSGLSRDRVFAQLRGENMRKLSSAKRLYMEANGNFTVVKETQEKPGLSIIPLLDKDLSTKQTVQHEFSSCTSCGFTFSALQDKFVNCPKCTAHDWTKAVL